MSESETIDDGGPAFPAMLPGGNYCTPGMSLRDWFAGQALAGLLASGDWDETPIPDAYVFAQAMLEQRERRNQ